MLTEYDPELLTGTAAGVPSSYTLTASATDFAPGLDQTGDDEWWVIPLLPELPPSKSPLDYLFGSEPELLDGGREARRARETLVAQLSRGRPSI